MFVTVADRVSKEKRFRNIESTATPFSGRTVCSDTVVALDCDLGITYVTYVRLEPRFCYGEEGYR